MKKNVLVVAAHPDDEILGCGATIARLSAEGYAVHILILAEGMTSRAGFRHDEAGLKQLKRLHRCVDKACRIVQAKSVQVLAFPDNRLDTVPMLELVRAVEAKKRMISPHIIFTHHGEDLNVDHRLTFEAVLTAFRPQPGEKRHAIYSFETPSSTEWQLQKSKRVFQPAHFFSLTKKHLDAKIRALHAYRSEIRHYPHPRSARALRALAEWRGSNIGSNYAEAFEVVRCVT